jgi:hypothetical protein
MNGKIKIIEKAPIAILAIIINALLFLLIPVLQVVFGSVPRRETPPEKIAVPIERAVEKPKKQLEKKEIKAIKSLARLQKRPTSPQSRTVKLDLSPVEGGEGVAVASGPVEVKTYDVGETDTDAKIIGGDRRPKMPLRARREEVEGYVDAIWVVNESGFAVEASILREEPPGYGFAKEVRKYLKGLRFKPATIENVPVRQKLKQRIRFELR